MSFEILSDILLKFNIVDYSMELAVNNPVQDDVPEKRIVVVGGKNYVKWVYMKCPCGCGSTLVLSLMKGHRPYWKIKKDKWNRLTLSPSVWKVDGCKSHFWVTKGKILWVKDELKE